MSDQSKRIRSPNYPMISLRQAIEQLPMLFERIHKHTAPKEAIAKALGYGGWNGTSASVVSAHNKYGLLDRGDSDQYKITDRAMRIMFPKSATESAEAIRDAAYAPSLYSELAENFEGAVPHSDILRPWLIRRGFAPAVVEAVIQGYRDTISLVTIPGSEATDSSTNPGEQDEKNFPIQPLTPLETPPVYSPLAPASSRQEIITDDDGNKIVLTFPSEPTVETYEFVKEYLEFRISRLQKTLKQKMEYMLS